MGRPSVIPAIKERLERYLEAIECVYLNSLRMIDSSCIAEVAKALAPNRPVLTVRIAVQIYAAMTARSKTNVSAKEELKFLTNPERMSVTDVRAARNLWRLVGSQKAAAVCRRTSHVTGFQLSLPISKKQK